jgi:hypothetical protein
MRKKAYRKARANGPAIVEAARKSPHIRKAVHGKHIRPVRARHGSRLLAAREPRTPIPRVRI